MPLYIAAVDAITGEILYGGFRLNEAGVRPYDVEPGLSPGQIRVEFPKQPNPKRERYSGDPRDPIRPATQEEQDAYADANRQARECPTSAIIEALTKSERKAWREAAASNDDIADDRERFFSRPTINVNSRELAQPLERMVQANILTPERVAALVASAAIPIQR